MHTFLVHVGDENFSRVLPAELNRSKSANGRVKVMAFPPLEIQTLAPVLRQRGHRVRLSDTCHPQMTAEHISQAAVREQPDVIALSFLSTTTYPAVKSMARRLKAEAAQIPIMVGGAFATLNADRILGDCPDIDCVGVGEGEELLPDYLEHLDAPGLVAGLVWRRDGRTVENAPRPLLRDLDRFPYPDRTSLPIDSIESRALLRSFSHRSVWPRPFQGRNVPSAWPRRAWPMVQSVSSISPTSSALTRAKPFASLAAVTGCLTAASAALTAFTRSASVLGQGSLGGI